MRCEGFAHDTCFSYSKLRWRRATTHMPTFVDHDAMRSKPRSNSRMSRPEGIGPATP